MLTFLIISAAYLHLVFSTEGSLECQVTIQNGTINGYIAKTGNPNKKVCAYTSIPYATPPVGPLRFQAPSPIAKKWDTLNATKNPNSCPQEKGFVSGPVISEDCLYLNVYQPKVNGSKNSAGGLPVMIWIHGGGFTTRSSVFYTPDKLLARADVILVVIHYRLGVLGFFSTGDSLVPGNNGLKDQALAIRWVNENIQAFGGNPGNVTIFGESAGAVSVTYQMISPLNKGLIHGVIAQSGTVLSSWAMDKHPGESGTMMAHRFNCSVTDKTAMIACLRKLSWQTLIKGQKGYASESLYNASYPRGGMTPVVEPKNLTGAFITEDPETILRSGDVPDIPLVIGANKHDGSFILELIYVGKILPRKLSTDASYLKHEVIPDLLKFVGVDDPQPAQRVVASSVETAFLSGVNRSNWDASMPGLVDAASVLFFKSAIQNTAEILSGRGRKVYLYSFEHHSNNTLGPKNKNISIHHGVAHADDLFPLFNIPGKFSPQDVSFSELFTDMWLNFARFGAPTPVADGRFHTWLPYNLKDEPFMKLNVTPTLEHGYRNSWRPNSFEWN